MNVGRVSNISYDYTVIGAGRAGRVSSASDRMPVAPVSPVGGKSAAPENEAARSHGSRSYVFYNSDGDSAEISLGAMNYYQNQAGLRPNALSPFPDNKLDLPGGGDAPVSLDALKPRGECKTCAGRRYVDKSDDASVSYQTPTKISPNMAAAAVASHENEHVGNERGKAQREGRRIVNQTVTLTYDLCPECGKTYVSGGTTRTTSAGKKDSGETPPGGISPNGETMAGEMFTKIPA